jgi:hypothetical protein
VGKPGHPGFPTLTSGHAPREEQNEPAERSHHGQDEQPLDDSDCQHDSEHYERSQQQQENDHADKVPLGIAR